jgi:exosome complex RNA-binding protein Rrp4
VTDIQRDIDGYREGQGEMRISERRDPIAWAGIAVTVVVNIAGIAWLAGRFDQRMANAEAAIAKLEAKAEKDASQDVKIAVISEQLATISAGVGEIKAKLETRR